MLYGFFHLPGPRAIRVRSAGWLLSFFLRSRRRKMPPTVPIRQRLGSVVAIVAAAALMGTACDERAPLLSDDQLCRVYVDQVLHDLTDLWATRYALGVVCDSGRGEILVTVVSANEERPLSKDAASDVQRMLQSSLDDIVTRNGWSARYRRAAVQVLG